MTERFLGVLLRYWAIDSWRNFHISQQPRYKDLDSLHRVESCLPILPPIVRPVEVDSLLDCLGCICETGGVLINLGDCAEDLTRDVAEDARSYALMIGEMQSILDGLNVVYIGRIAGQLTKPRSLAYEHRDGRFLPSYRGEMANRHDFSKEARAADPARVIEGHFYSLSKYKALQNCMKCPCYISHEALLLSYEQAMTRIVEQSCYCLSAHMLWVGNRTRYLGSAHLEYIRGIVNPVGIKIDANISPVHVVGLIRMLNPGNIPGKIVLICRFGCYNVELALKGMVEAVRASGLRVVWVCDPMHGNTRWALGMMKVRFLEDLRAECSLFFKITMGFGVNAIGLSLESNAGCAVECYESREAFGADIVAGGSLCDPRLNVKQTAEFVSILKNSWVLEGE